MPIGIGAWKLALRDAIQELPSTIARLELLTSFQQTHIVGPCPLVPEEQDRTQVEVLLTSMHEEAFSEWLNYSLEEQHADLSLYFSALSYDKANAVKCWLEFEPYRRFIPPSADLAEAELFVADLKVLLGLIAHGVPESTGAGAYAPHATQVEFITAQGLSRWLGVPLHLLCVWSARHKRFLVKADRNSRFSISAIREWLRANGADSPRYLTCGIRCSESGIAKLSLREREVLTLIGQGKSTKEIAESLSLKETTIAEYRKRICRKLDLHSTGELAACAAALLTGTCRTRAADDEICPL